MTGEAEMQADGPPRDERETKIAIVTGAAHGAVEALVCAMLDEPDMEPMARMYDFGVKAGWPQAETMCRQFCDYTGKVFDPARWRENGPERVFWAAFTAAGAAIAPLKLFPDPPKAAVRRDPHLGHERGFEQSPGAFERQRISGPRSKRARQPEGGVVQPPPVIDLEAVKGIGQKTGDRLRALGIASAHELVTADLDALRDMDADLADRIEKGGLIDAARAAIAGDKPGILNRMRNALTGKR